MYRIVLVCTHHSELGKCNSEELYKILESLRPDVIFEELPQDLFDRFYKENSIPCEPPEIKAVKRFIRKYAVINLPVDSPLSVRLACDDINYMFKILRKHNSFSKLEESQQKQIFEKGYAFLNSKENEVLTESKMSLSKELLECDINRRRLSQLHRAFYEEQHRREYDILKCIHYHSQRLFYNQGVLLLGSGHRRSMREKIEGYSSSSDIKLSWTLFGDAN